MPFPKNRYVISVALNGDSYATFERAENRGDLLAWTDDVGDRLPTRIDQALTQLEEALESEPSNEASHETRPVEFVPAGEAEAIAIALLTGKRSWSELVAAALRGDATAKRMIDTIGDFQDKQAVEDILDRRA